MADKRTHASEASRLADAFRQLLSQTMRLVKLELELAGDEIAAKRRAVAASAALLLAAALFGFLALCVVTAAAVLLIATVVVSWLAALIVFVAYLALATSMVLLGMRRLKRATPLLPARAIESVKGDLKWVETQLRSAGK